MTTRNFPRPRDSATWQQWADKLSAYLVRGSPIKEQSQARALQLAHKLESAGTSSGGNVGLERPASPGVLMYNPIAGALTYSYNNQWTNVFGNTVGGIRWSNAWVPGSSYIKGDIVNAYPYLAVANKDTTDRPDPQPIGERIYVYKGADVVNTIAAKELILGLELTLPFPIMITDLKVYSTLGYKYRIYYSIDSTVTQLRSFTGDAAGWLSFPADGVFVPAGAAFTLYASMFKPALSPIGFNGDWNYSRPETSNVSPASGEMSHSEAEQNKIYFSQYDTSVVDHTTNLNTLSAGDSLDIDGVRYSVVAVTALGSGAFSVEVSPPIRLPIAGLKTVTFEYTASTPLRTIVDPNYYSADPSIRCLSQVNAGTVNYTNDAYGIDVRYQILSPSDDWDIVALSSST